MFSLEGRTILVTGASKGIGAVTARTLGEAGAHVVAHYHSDRAGVEEAVAAIPKDRRLVISANFAEMAEVDRLWREAMAWRNGVDVLVNNAATMIQAGGIDDDDATWDRVWAGTMNVNLLAPARLMRNAVRHFRERKSGIVVTMSSWVAQRGATNPDSIAYAAAKGGLRAATQTMARAFAKENVLCYMIAPGVVRTRMSEDFAATQGGEALVTAGLTMREWVPPQDIANLVVFLASGACRHLTGATLDVNGASYVR